jgi:predicted PolB exonuclease-like 3'-5' exonuclease
MANTLVFDIETVPLEFDSSFDDVQKEYLLRGAKTDEEIEYIKHLGGLNPLLGKIVCIGIYLIESKQGFALYLDESDQEDTTELEEMKLKFKSFTEERDMIEHFWKGLTADSYSAYVSFNGRGFDCPFLMLRSAVLGIRPSVNLMAGTRWNFTVASNRRDVEHIDLLDKLTYGAGFDKTGATRRFNLDFYTKAFGVPSPKTEGITGYDVPRFFADGKMREIAEYCLRDVRSTGDLYEKWLELLKF